MTVVRAAGGVVWRTPAGGTGTDREIALVHRPRYGDWTLPKGKLEPAEPALCAAVREVWEETGIEAVPQLRLPSIRYLTGEPGVEKSVDFWCMRAATVSPREPDHEVSEVRWVPVADAPAVLTYVHDRGVVAAFAALPPVDAQILLVRHAHAGTRDGWAGPDQSRPLDAAGLAQAQRLASLLRLFAPQRVVSAPALRCRQTVAPLGLPATVDPAFVETAPVPAALAALRNLAALGGTSVVCSQGRLIPALLAALRPANAAVTGDFGTAKGDGWLLGFERDRVRAADRLDATEPVLRH